MPKLTLDPNGSLEIMQTKGVVFEITRAFILSGFNDTDGSGNHITDLGELWQLINEAEDDTTRDKIPRLGNLVNITTNPGETDAFAVCTDRNFKLQDYNTVTGDLLYKYVPNVWKADTGLQGIETGLNRDGVPITITHPDGKTEQGGVLKVRVPRTTLTYDYMKLMRFRDSPLTEVRGRVGFVNEETWGGGGEGEWLITAVNYEYLAPEDRVLGSGAWYHFNIQFEHEPDGHQPEIWYIDPETNKPAPGITKENGGIKQVDWYRVLNFKSVGYREP